MKGYIKQRSKGSWTIVVEAGKDPETGKRKQRWHTIRGNKRDVQRALREMLTAVESGTYAKPSKLNLGEWLIQWLESYVAMHTTPRTQESYRYVIKTHLVPAMGSVPLYQLQPQHLLNYYGRALSQGRADGKGGLSARSVLYQHRILSEALSHAVKMGYLVRNVAESIKPPKPVRAAVSTLSPDDIERFLDAAKDTPYYVFFCTLLYTGLRRGELLALKWRNLDLDQGFIHVVESAYKLGNGEYVIKEPKTPHSRRAVALPQSLVALLKYYRDQQAATMKSLGAAIDEKGFVFTTFDGKPLDPSGVSRAFARMIKHAGIPHIRLHDLRHTHATIMLKAGVHPKIVSERLGHATVGITLDTYSHVLPGLQEAAADKFDKMIGNGMARIDEGNVSKPLAEKEDLRSEPCRSRTCDHLIKSKGVASGLRQLSFIAKSGQNHPKFRT
jgi:integrase